MPDAISTPDAAPAADAQNQAMPKDVANAASEQNKPAPKALKIKDREFKSEDDAYAEIERGRQSSKLLTEAHKRLEQSAQKDKAFEARKKAAKTDFSKAIEALELTREEAVELASKWLYDTEILPKQMSPEQQKHRATEDELKRLKAERDGEAKTRQKQEFEQKVSGEIQRLRAELEGVLKEKKVPSTRIALRRMANYMKAYQESGVEIPASRAADMLIADYQQEFGELLDEADPSQLEEFLGKDRMQKLAKNISRWALGKLKGAGQQAQATAPDAPKTAKEKKMTPSEFNKYIGGLG